MPDPVLKRTTVSPSVTDPSSISLCKAGRHAAPSGEPVGERAPTGQVRAEQQEMAEYVRNGVNAGGQYVEVHVEHAPHELCCHDAAGWRRDRVPERPRGWPVRIRPDWVCEIVSPSTASRDRVTLRCRRGGSSRRGLRTSLRGQR